MGSPCNTFGNEPDSGAGVAAAPSGNGSIPGEGGAKNWSNGTGTATSGANCPRVPQFWGAIEGPDSGKVQGDRYQTRPCDGSGVDYCSGGNNSEYRQSGYFFVVRVSEQMVGREVRLQLYDPAMVSGAGQQCQNMPDDSSLNNNMNPYVGTDAKLRYGDPDGQPNATSRTASYGFCTGDALYGDGSSQMTTTFALRQQVDSQNPNQAPLQNDVGGSPCIRQFTGAALSTDGGGGLGVNQLRRNSGNSRYNDQLARVFHNWVSFCTFTPARNGDYYLQVRSNVSPTGGSPFTQTNGRPDIVFRGASSTAIADNGNTTSGNGYNAFAMRAVVSPGFEQYVSVSGYGAMPILANAPSADSEFHLLRVLPGAAGQYISFQFFDAADISGSTGGTVRVIRPADATGSIQTTPFPGRCKTRKPAATQTWTNASNDNCRFNVSSPNNNGKVQEVQIPIPTDYTCNFNDPTGCWYKVEITFPGATVNDLTTWNAEIVGDPLRLVE